MSVLHSSNISLRQRIEGLRDQLGITAKRSLGQNFLISDHVVDTIFETLDRWKPKQVVEVGPGLGSLTEALIEKSYSRHLIEMDTDLAQYWRSRGESVFEADALQFNWNSLNLNPGTCLLSNLPYQIGARLLIDRCEGPKEIDRMILMFQKEVAQRMMAKPSTKDYGFLSIVTQSYWRLDKVCDVSPSSFSPAPKVDSRVVSFIRLAGGPDPKSFIPFVKKSFQFRRKLLIKNLSDEKEKLPLVLKDLGFDSKVRGEALSVDDFQKLHQGLIEK